MNFLLIFASWICFYKLIDIMIRLIIFIMSFLTQHNKIQHMIKYTVTVLVTKQQTSKKHILGIAKTHKIRLLWKSVNISLCISPWYLKIYRYLKKLMIYVYMHMYTCIYTGDIHYAQYTWHRTTKMLLSSLTFYKKFYFGWISDLLLRHGSTSTN